MIPLVTGILLFSCLSLRPGSKSMFAPASACFLIHCSSKIANWKGIVERVLGHISGSDLNAFLISLSASVKKMDVPDQISALDFMLTNATPFASRTEALLALFSVCKQATREKFINRVFALQFLEHY